MEEYRPAETFDQSKRSKNTFVNGLLKGCAGAKESSELTLPSLSFPRSPSRAGFSRTLRSNHPFHAEETRSLWGRRGPRLGVSCVRSVHLENSVQGRS